MCTSGDNHHVHQKWLGTEGFIKDKDLQSFSTAFHSTAFESARECHGFKHHKPGHIAVIIAHTPILSNVEVDISDHIISNN